MKLYYWDGQNFGDQLNAVLWPKLIGDVLDDDDSVRFVGIGTLLSNTLPTEPKKYIFGTGAGYFNRLPVINDTFRFLCVRGPLTAACLKLSSNMAVTDGALLCRLLEWPLVENKHSTLLIPHWESMHSTDWAEVARQAEVELVDPQLSPETVLGKIRGARLVITESLHGAIMADTFRVPWIPVLAFPQVNCAKWVDWTASHGMVFEPKVMLSIYRKFFSDPRKYAVPTKKAGRFERFIEREGAKMRKRAVKMMPKRVFNELVKNIRALRVSGQGYISSDFRSANLLSELKLRMEDFVASQIKSQSALRV